MVFKLVSRNVSGITTTVIWFAMVDAIVKLIPFIAIEPFGTMYCFSSSGTCIVIVADSPVFTIELIDPTPSTCPWTKCPPNRPFADMARSRFTWTPDLKYTNVVLDKVSSTACAVKRSFIMDTTLRHMPSTATLSPICKSSVTFVDNISNSFPSGLD